VRQRIGIHEDGSSGFRSDLYYRLNFSRLAAALEGAKTFLLCHAFREDFTPHGKASRHHSSGNMAAFQWYSWPGTIAVAVLWKLY